MLKITHYLIFLLCINHILVMNAKFPRYQLTWTYLNCSHNTKYVRSMDCVIQEPERLYYDMNVNFLRDMSSGFTVHTRMDVVRPPDGRLINVMDFDLDICKFFAGQRDNNLVEMVRKGFGDHGNFTNKCPLKKGVTYGLYNFTVDISKFPYVPDSDIKTTLLMKIPINNEVLRVEIRCKLQPGRKP